MRRVIVWLENPHITPHAFANKNSVAFSDVTICWKNSKNPNWISFALTHILFGRTRLLWRLSASWLYTVWFRLSRRRFWPWRRIVWLNRGVRNRKKKFNQIKKLLLSSVLSIAASQPIGNRLRSPPSYISQTQISYIRFGEPLTKLT